MISIGRLADYVGGGQSCERCARSPTVLYECVRCGTSVGGSTERCPQCDATNIARYEI